VQITTIDAHKMPQGRHFGAPFSLR